MMRSNAAVKRDRTGDRAATAIDLFIFSLLEVGPGGDIFG